MMLLAFKFSYNLVGLFCHLFVHILTLLVIFVDVVSFCQRLLKVALYQQVYSLCTVLHTSRRIDTWTNLENDIAHGNLTSCKTANLNNRL